MKKFMYKCQTCSTIMSIETDLDPKYIHMAPPCICGKSRMISMASDEYAYGMLNRKNGWE
jgi:hypothetical protein